MTKEVANKFCQALIDSLRDSPEEWELERIPTIMESHYHYSLLRGDIKIELITYAHHKIRVRDKMVNVDMADKSYTKFLTQDINYLWDEKGKVQRILDDVEENEMILDLLKNDFKIN